MARLVFLRLSAAGIAGIALASLGLSAGPWQFAAGLSLFIASLVAAVLCVRRSVVLWADDAPVLHEPREGAAAGPVPVWSASSFADEDERVDLRALKALSVIHRQSLVARWRETVLWRADGTADYSAWLIVAEGFLDERGFRGRALDRCEAAAVLTAEVETLASAGLAPCDPAPAGGEIGAPCRKAPGLGAVLPALASSVRQKAPALTRWCADVEAPFHDGRGLGLLASQGD